MFNFNRDFLVGFISGAVCGAAGYRLYEQSNGQLQNLIQPAGAPNFASNNGQPTIEELVAQKERLEDLIAEQQMA